MHGLVCLSCLVSFGLASSVQPKEGQLIPKRASEARWEAAESRWTAALEESISDLDTNLAVSAAPPSHLSYAAAAAKEDVVTSDAEDKKTGSSVMTMPVKKKISMQEMDAFIKTLTPGCGEHFENMLDGKDKFHTFGSAWVGPTARNCAKLGGTLCTTDAEITTEALLALRSRNLASTMSAQGNSCLPKQCVTTSDLHNVASFMGKQAVAIIDGDAHHVKLSVDCSKDGGSSASIESGAALMAPTVLVLAAALVLNLVGF